MARVETVNPAGPLQDFKFIIPDGMTIIASITANEISTE